MRHASCVAEAQMQSQAITPRQDAGKAIQRAQVTHYVQLVMCEKA